MKNIYVPSKCHGIDTSSTTAPFALSLSADFLTNSLTSASKLGSNPSLSKPTRKLLISPDNYSSNQNDHSALFLTSEDRVQQ